MTTEEPVAKHVVVVFNDLDVVVVLMVVVVVEVVASSTI